MEKIDRLYVASTTSFVPTDIRLTSLYAFVAGDPMNVRRFVSTRAQAQRMRSLRRDLFGIAAAGVAGTPPPAQEAQGIRELLDDDAAARLMRSHWLSEFPAFVINNGTMGLIRKNQYQLYGERYIDCDFSNPDFAALAAAFGIAYHRIEQLSDIDDLFQRADLEAAINLVEIVMDKHAFPTYLSSR